MNKGTKIRTVTAIVIMLNTICAILHIFSFGLAYDVLSIAAVIIAWGASHYYNNDYSVEHAEATGYARLRRETKKAGYVGENFFDEGQEVMDKEDK
jgi:hypothetical protein